MADIVTDATVFPHAFDKALNAGDLDRLLTLYEETAALRVRSGAVHSGIDAVRAEMSQMIAAGAHITNTLRHTIRQDDTALIIVDYVLRVTMPEGEQVEVTGTATNVIRCHPEKGWRLLIANPQGVA